MAAEVDAVWNLRNNVKTLNEETKAIIRSIQQVASESFRTAQHSTPYSPHRQQPHRHAPPQGDRQVQRQSSHPRGNVPYQNAPYKKYQGIFKNSDKPVEEKILNNLILSKLNKFSIETFTEVELFLCQILDSGELEFIKDFMMLVFKKAAIEEVFCPLYAQLLSKLSIKYPHLLVELKTLYKAYLTIFEEIKEDDVSSIKLNSEKAYRRGYSQFLAELAGYQVLDKENIQEVFIKLINLIRKFIVLPDNKALVDEYSDCLLRISRVVKKTAFYNETKHTIKSLCAEELMSFTKINPAWLSLTSRTRFQCMEIFENIS